VTYEHYGLNYSERRSDSGLPANGAEGGQVGHDTSGPTTDDAMTRSEEEHEVVLHEEEPVVEKRTVPKERVRMEKDSVTDEAQVSEEVR
jgi:stress response protein YsnF